MAPSRSTGRGVFVPPLKRGHPGSVFSRDVYSQLTVLTSDALGFSTSGFSADTRLPPGSAAFSSARYVPSDPSYPWWVSAPGLIIEPSSLAPGSKPCVCHALLILTRVTGPTTQ